MSDDINIDATDVDEAMKFFEFFNIPMSPELTAAVVAFKVLPVASTRRELVKQLGKQVISSSEVALQDKIFDDIKSQIVETLKQYEEEDQHVE